MSGDSDPIEVVAYDERWVERFAIAERELRAALAPFVVEIEHIGSTAVPGVAAKPVIDIQVGVRTLDESAAIVSAVESLGYEYVPEFEDQLPDRRYFRRWADVATRSILSSVPTPTGGIDISGFETGFATTTMIGIGMRDSRWTLLPFIGTTAGRTPTRRPTSFVRSNRSRSPPTPSPASTGTATGDRWLMPDRRALARGAPMAMSPRRPLRRPKRRGANNGSP